MKTKKEKKLVIYKSRDRGPEEWALANEDHREFWLTCFDSLEEAQKYCKENNLKVTVEK